MNKNVSHPDHYNWHPHYESIEVVRYFPGLLTYVGKYVWRAGRKDDLKQDLGKALTYLKFEIEMLNKVKAKLNPYKYNIYYPGMLFKLDKKLILEGFEGKQRELMLLLIEASESATKYITATNYINVRLLPIQKTLEEVLSKL